jgi:hypothetical protein
VSVPVIIVVLPLEGEAVARLSCSTYEEELRLALDVFDRETILEVCAALGRLRAAMEEREAEA